MRRGGFEAVCAAVLISLSAYLPARAAGIQAPAAKPTPAAGARIVADSAPYHIDWNGTSGMFTRSAFAQQPELKQPLVFLHTDPGPTGFAKYLAWFLARDLQGYALIWCYLNDSGTGFDSWVYRFPANQLTTLHFNGQYQYTPPVEPPPASPMENFTLSSFPVYSGPAFAYRDWTRVIGALPSLALQTTHRGTAAAPAVEASAVVKTLTQISVRPLHHVQVGAANGWREGGWNELHALAFDSQSDPYYLILYSNSKKGYAVDLKRAQIYVADYGSRVTFSDEHQFGPDDNPLNAEPEIKVRRYERHEIVLTTQEKLANPYVDAQVGVEFTGPDARAVRVPGFWDGAGTFRVRFTPTLTGRWKWHSLSMTPDLGGQTGEFECVNEGPGGKGFVGVQTNIRDPHHFAYANGDPFLPALIREPAPKYAPLNTAAKGEAAGGESVQLAGLVQAAQPSASASFLAYQRFVNTAAQMGFTRLLGGSLLGPAATGSVRVNEGGPAFTGSDLDHLNPAFFQWMDRRIAYCNARGIVPDIGIGTLEDALFTSFKPIALYRFWSYVVARYASFDVQWSLFEPASSAASDATRKSAEQFADLTRLVDAGHHPLTVVLPGPTAVAVAAPQPDRTGAPGGGASPFQGRFGNGAGRSRQTAPAAPAERGSRGAMAGTIEAKKQIVPYDLAWEDVITISGGDVSALPSDSWYSKPLVLKEPAAGPDTAIAPDITRHRMWEARMRGAYWTPGLIPTLDAGSLTAPEFQYASICAEIFGKTRFSRLRPRPDMLGGPAESSADRKRRKKAEAAEARRNPPPPADDGSDFDPFNADPFAAEPAPIPAPPKPKPMFVMVDPAREYLVYFEEGGTMLLDLLEATGKVQITWINPRTGEATKPKEIIGGAYSPFTAPDDKDWVLYIGRL